MHPTVRIEAVRAAPDPNMLRSLAEDIAALRFSIPIDRMVRLEDAGEAQAAAAKGSSGKIILLA